MGFGVEVGDVGEGEACAGVVALGGVGEEVEMGGSGGGLWWVI